MTRDGEHLHPQADEGQVENQQHEVGDEKARHQTPNQRGIGHKEEGARLQAELLEAGKHDCSRGRSGQAQRQERHESSGGGSIVGRFRSGHAFDCTFAEFFRMFRELPFRRIGKEARHIGAARWHGADWKADCGAAKPRHPRAFPVVLRHPDGTLDGDDLIFWPKLLRHDCECFADSEQRDCQCGDIDPIEQVRRSHDETRLTGQLVDADQSERKADEQGCQAAQCGIAEGR